MTLGTFETLGVLAVLERLFASRTNQHFQEVFGNHDLALYDRGSVGIVTVRTEGQNGNHHWQRKSPRRQGDTEEIKASGTPCLEKRCTTAELIGCWLILLRDSVSPW